MKKVFAKARAAITEASEKFTIFRAEPGQTVYPLKQKDLENLGMRWVYRGKKHPNSDEINTFVVKPNDGEVHHSMAQWRKKNDGANLGEMHVKKDGTSEDVAAAWDIFEKTFKGIGSEESAKESKDSNSAKSAKESKGSTSGEGRPSAGEAGALGTGTEASNSSEWDWWSDEGIRHRRMNGVDEWSAPESGEDSEWIYSKRLRKQFLKRANGDAVWEGEE